MTALVFIETDEHKAKKSSLEAVSYAHALTHDVIALVFGLVQDFEGIGKAGASKVLHIEDEQVASPNIMTYASVVEEIMSQQADILLLAKSGTSDALAARVSIKIDAVFANNICTLPDTSSGFVVKQSIYTGKAFAYTELKGKKKILSIKKNTVPILTNGKPPQITPFSPSINDKKEPLKIIKVEKTKSEVLLPEADIVVSGGRGLKGPENWSMIEALAKILGAATGCSKPVSDMEWRPHHEHVGQTGIKVSPSLYIAIGISGAIQHLAGVNSSKYILVINKDADAPFFKAADYGIVGDAFEVIPKLIEIIKKVKKNGS